MAVTIPAPLFLIPLSSKRGQDRFVLLLPFQDLVLAFEYFGISVAVITHSLKKLTFHRTESFCLLVEVKAASLPICILGKFLSQGKKLCSLEFKSTNPLCKGDKFLKAY